MNGLVQVIRSLGPVRLGVMGLVAVGLIGFFLFLTLRMATPSLALLFSDLTVEDSSKIVGKLDGMNVPYVLKGDGTMIMVPEDRVLKLLMALAEEGLPSGGAVGYELFDQKEAFGTTSFVQNINQMRALEGELARTIRTIDRVVAARVHLVLPKHELFAREAQEPSASIVLKLRGGLARGQVQAVQHLVASAVPGLKPARVTVVDEHGTLLANGDGPEGDNMLAASLDERTTSFEGRMRQQIEQLVGSIVGAGKVRVQVSAEVDFSRLTQNSEIYDPESQVVRSKQEVEQNDESSEQNEGVTVANNLPQQNQQAANAPGAQSRNARTEETTNYEISKTTRTEIREAGQTKRLSIAVLVDGSYKTGAKGERSYVARTPEEMKQIEALVRSAIGYDEKRGDQVRIENLRFAEFEDFAPQEEEGSLLGLPRGDLLRMVETVVLGVVALLVAILVIKPVLNRALAGPGERGGFSTRFALAGASGGMAEGGTLAGGELQAALPGQANTPALPPPGGSAAALSAVESMIDIAQVEGQVKESSIRKVGEIVQRHPEQAMAIMRSWLHEQR